MRGLTQTGMTIILVSHNMAAIQSSCQRVLLLNNGQLIADGEPLPVIEQFRKMLETGGSAGDDRLNLAGVSSDEFVSIRAPPDVRCQWSAQAGIFIRRTHLDPDRLECKTAHRAPNDQFWTATW